MLQGAASRCEPSSPRLLCRCGSGSRSRRGSVGVPPVFLVSIGVSPDTFYFYHPLSASSRPVQANARIQPRVVSVPRFVSLSSSLGPRPQSLGFLFATPGVSNRFHLTVPSVGRAFVVSFSPPSALILCSRLSSRVHASPRVASCVFLCLLVPHYCITASSLSPSVYPLHLHQSMPSFDFAVPFHSSCPSPPVCRAERWPQAPHSLSNSPQKSLKRTASERFSARLTSQRSCIRSRLLFCSVPLFVAAWLFLR